MDFFIQDTKQQLEMDYLLSKIKVQTPFGMKKKKTMQMYKAGDSSALYAHYETLELLIKRMEKQPVTFKKIREIFNHFKPIELTLKRIYEGETLSETEFFEIKNFCYQLRRLSDICDDLEGLSYLKPKRLEDVERLLDPEGLEINTFYLYDGYSEPLRRIRKEMKALESEIQHDKRHRRKTLAEHLELSIRPNDEVAIEKHQIETVKKLEAHEAFVYVSDTIMHRTFKIKTSDESLQKSQLISDLKRLEEEEEYKIREQLTRELALHLEAIQKNIAAIAWLDLMLAKAYFAKAYQMVRPTLTDRTEIVMEEGVHLKVQEHLKQENLDFMPISMKLSSGMSCITGANMGGKTICLKLIGQMIILAQLGMFVPCKAFRYKPMDFVFISSQDAQSIDRGLSTFGAEMVNVSEVLKIADQGGLILIDELARGTNPKEGYAISKAIINYLKTKPSIAVITTHIDGLADEKDVLHLQVTGLSEVDFEDLEINIGRSNLENVHQLMDYRLKVIDEKESVPKDAIKISRLMGVQGSILEDARRILDKEE